MSDALCTKYGQVSSIMDKDRDGMNSSLEEVFQTNAEIYKECLHNEHAAVIILAEERWVPAICSKCIEKLEDFE